MESIQKLREICQSTRPSIFKDPLSKIYYFLSIYFTWAFLKLNFSANQVTIFSAFIAFFGGILVSLDNKFFILFGGICFHLFAIFDMCDGEVARYRNQGGVNGHFLDWYMHFLVPSFLIMGLFISSFENINNLFFIVISTSALLTPILLKSIQSAGWTVVSWTILRNKLSNEKIISVSFDEKDKKSLSKFFKAVRLIFTSPFEDRWASLLILMLPLLDLFLFFLKFDFLDYRFYWLIYVGIFGPFLIYLKIKEILDNSSLQKALSRIENPSHQVKLPDDDFI